MSHTSDSYSLLGVDIGGTFTDFVLFAGGQIVLHKRPTMPLDPAQAVLDGVAHLQLRADADVVHGSTIATNALLERRGARTALVTTRGFADVIEIGRQNRSDLYVLLPRKPEPLVPPALRFEVDERLSADGNVLVALNPADLPALADQLVEAGVESVAVCLLFSFLYPNHERQIGEALRGRMSVSLSSDILPEYREYERTSTTVINAYVSPLVDRYLGRLESGLNGRHLRIMQSNGGVITAPAARRESARTVLSGPAGGAVGAFYIARQAGFERIISLDMGGTSTDVALFPGRILRTTESSIGGFPLRLPMVDIHTVGAGGGSLARVDAGGALRVGPESAGADPGPACYGRGTSPTTSDANLLLGRLHADHFLGGEMRLFPDCAYEALARLADDLGVATPEHAAWGVIQVTNAAMERAIRTISVERGYDPRDFVLVPFGGAGPLHACALAEALQMPLILIPRVPGVLSALGMLIADLVKDYSQHVMERLDRLTAPALDAIFAPLAERAIAEMVAEGIASQEILLERALDMRYVGQSHELTVAEPHDEDWAAAFHAAHDQRYGHRHDDEPVEVVTIRVKAIGRGPKPEFQMLPNAGPDSRPAQIGESRVWFSQAGPIPSSLYDRDLLRAGNRLMGPAVIFQMDATTVVAPNWQAEVDPWGNLLLTR